MLAFALICFLYISCPKDIWCMKKRHFIIQNILQLLFGKSKHQIIVKKCQQEICEFGDYF